MLSTIENLKQQVEVRKEAHIKLQKDKEEAINQQGTIKTELKQMLDEVNRQGAEQI